ncbi:hypothetical protein D3C81_1489860 [compost metagenome]
MSRSIDCSSLNWKSTSAPLGMGEGVSAVACASMIRSRRRAAHRRIGRRCAGAPRMADSCGAASNCRRRASSLPTMVEPAGRSQNAGSPIPIQRTPSRSPTPCIRPSTRSARRKSRPSSWAAAAQSSRTASWTSVRTRWRTCSARWACARETAWPSCWRTIRACSSCAGARNAAVSSISA